MTMQSENQMNDKPRFSAIITAAVRYDETLSPSAKLLFAEIAGLAGKCGYCFSSNAYFQRVFGMSERQVQRLLGELEKSGYIRTEIVGKSKTKQRHIFPTEASGWVNNTTKMSSEMSPSPDKNVADMRQKCRETHDKNVTHNNNIYNNRFNNNIYYNKTNKQEEDIFTDAIDHDELEKLVWNNLGK